MFLILTLILFVNLNLQNYDNFQNQDNNIFNPKDDFCMCKKRPTIEEDKIGIVNKKKEKIRVEKRAKEILSQDVQEEQGLLFSEELEEGSIPVVPQKQNISGNIDDENKLGLRATEKNEVVKDLEKNEKQKRQYYTLSL